MNQIQGAAGLDGCWGNRVQGRNTSSRADGVVIGMWKHLVPAAVSRAEWVNARVIFRAYYYNVAFCRHHTAP